MQACIHLGGHYWWMRIYIVKHSVLLAGEGGEGKHALIAFILY